MWDVAYCAFNMVERRMVNGVMVKRYAHVLPANHAALAWTYTTTPYTAAQILDFLFAAPTTETPWTRVYHAFLAQPVFNLDYLTGRKLGLVVEEISRRLGLTFTLQGGRYRLVWAAKGVGALPDFPETAQRRRGPGLALSGNPTRVRILGDRNLYQVLNIDMVPDWLPAWQEFYDFNAFVRDIFLHERTEEQIANVPAGTTYASIDPETENNAGYLLARARAQRITVGEYAALRQARDGTGANYADTRMFQHRSRLSMPVALYLSNVLFKAFRFPNGFTITNYAGVQLGLQSLSVVEQSLVEVTHNPLTGVMTATGNANPGGNGYAIVRGYQVAADAFKSLNPEYFNIDQWLGQQALWQAASFNVDDSGAGDQFIVFDEPVVSTVDLIQNPIINGVTQPYGVLRTETDLKVRVPQVRAALTFAAEQFSWVAGTGTKDDVENVSGLFSEYVENWGGAPVELNAYADGQSATQKAIALAATLLNRQFVFQDGGWLDPVCRGTQLTPMLDRVQVTVNGDGIMEEVDFTSERARNVTFDARGTPYLQLEGERDFTKRATLDTPLAGQAELRHESNQLRLQAALLLKNPRLSRMLVDTFHRIMGLDATPDTVVFQDRATVQLPVGAPVFREMTAKTPFRPRASGAPTFTHPVFMGVTVVDGEWADGPVRVTRLGNDGVVLARVRGPVALNDPLGVSEESGNKAALDYLSRNSTLPVLQALEEVSEGETRLIRARAVGAGGGGGSDPVWLP